MTDMIIRIAVDAMGGDNVPGVLVEGSAAAVRKYSDVWVTLVGNESKVNDYIDKLRGRENPGKSRAADEKTDWSRIRVVHSEEVIDMNDAPARAIRTKKDASIVVANKLCRSGEVDAVISAGNTGAAMAASLLFMGRLQGVSRPAIMTLFPSMKGVVAVLDLGANTDCKPEHLYQFAIMASIFVSHIVGNKNPRVGLLSIGEERSKGNELTIGAYDLLEKSELNFIGNIEGRDIFQGTADIIVCDGFVGNVLLKFGESIFGFITYSVRKNIMKSIWRKMGAYLLKPVFKEIKAEMSPEEYGGAPLLGVDGISIICHGNSSDIAIMNAIRVARRLVVEKVNDLIKSELANKNLGKK